jgi:hypothetical protein
MYGTIKEYGHGIPMGIQNGKVAQVLRDDPGERGLGRDRLVTHPSAYDACGQERKIGAGSSPFR